MDITLRQLAAFKAVAQAASFTAAAGELHVSQSSLSRVVADLERSLGFRLMERDTRNVELTPTGAELLRIAGEILNAHAAGMKELERFCQGESGAVVVATLPSVAAVLLPQVISVFRAQRPHCAVHIMDGLERAALDHVLSGEADIALTTIGQTSDRLEHHPLVRDRFVAVLPQDHRLVSHPAVSWTDLAGESFLAISRDSSVRRLTDAAFAQVDVYAMPAAEATSVATIGGLVAAGLGVTALPALVLPLIAAGPVVYRPLVAPEVDRRLDLVVRARRTLPVGAQRFLELLEEYRREGRDLPEWVSWA